MNFFFAAIGLPVSLALNLYTGDINLLFDVYLPGEKQDLTLGLCIFISGIFGICITVFTMLTVTLVGPFAINFSGTIGGVMLTFVGFIFFDDATLTLPVAIGLVISFSGAIHFTICKYYELNAANKVEDKKKN